MIYDNLDRNVRDAVEEFCVKIIDNDVLAVIISGSWVNGIPNENSDIDINIITREIGFRKRGNLFVRGLEIEYFQNPLSQMYNYIRTESNFRPVTADMIATGIPYFILDGAKGDIYEFINTCKQIINDPPVALTNSQIERYKYLIDDFFKDIKDIYSSDRFGTNLLISDLVNIAIEIVLKINRKRLVKRKRLGNYLSDIDSRFYNILTNLLKYPEINSLNDMVEYLELLLGGSRSDNWELENRLD